MMSRNVNSQSLADGATSEFFLYGARIYRLHDSLTSSPVCSLHFFLNERTQRLSGREESPVYCIYGMVNAHNDTGKSAALFAQDQDVM